MPRNLKTTRVRQALLSAAFDPSKPGHLGPILDGASEEYLVMRAREFLYEGINSTDSAIRRSRLRDALSIAAFALTKTNERATKEI